ncbi:MAG: helix-turn-helix transcriptional regulator [Clostridiales bacterium]|nr:helix-turn-helix transcriptional regulator [Clostridiales bacterium]
MDISTALRARIFELCDERNITYNKLGTICGITQSTLKNILSGRNGATVITIKKLCDGLEITIGEFFSTPVFDGLEQEIR